MFCASLRKRPEWAAAIPFLLRKETRDWKGTSCISACQETHGALNSSYRPEKRLSTHDLAMPLPGPATIDRGGVCLRFVLLSALDVKQPETMQRIERLYNFEGGRRCAIVFLLPTNDNECGVPALGWLQVEYANNRRCRSSSLHVGANELLRIMEKFISIPILPLTSVSELPTTLEAFHHTLLPREPFTVVPAFRESRALLQHCSTHGPIPESQTLLLSDLNSSFSDLVDKTSDVQGRDILHDYVPDVAERVIQFWTTEAEEITSKSGRVCWE
jgi:hypothetical protein